MKSLRRDKDRLTEAGQELAKQSGEALGPIFKAFAAVGHSPREISRIIVDVVLDLEASCSKNSKL